tara:strand:+ start:420 stop:725 length:306 start_codon:yes stop_codon:yes gene_type:complete
MSIAFKPKIPDSFEQLKKVAVVPVLMPESVTSRIYWSEEEMDVLIRMRALNLPLSECGKRIKRSANSCGGVIHHYQLYSTIEKKREELIKVVLNGYDKTNR